MDKTLLDEIKKAEKDANRKLEKAEKQKGEIILEMGKDARSLEEKELKRLKKEMEDAIRQWEGKTEKERERFLEEKKTEMQRLQKDAGKKVEKAVEGLKKEFHAFLSE